jgi:hypothetical protein
MIAAGRKLTGQKIGRTSRAEDIFWANFSANRVQRVKPRLGSETDVKRLSETFALMGYDVRTPYVDLTKDELLALLKSIHEADHSLCDSFILCIL